MTHHNVFLYGGRYPVQTSLLSPKPAFASMDLRDNSEAGTSFDSGCEASPGSYNMASYHQSRLHNFFSYEEDTAPLLSGNSCSLSSCSGNTNRKGKSDDSSEGYDDSSNQSCLSKRSADDSDMEFEIYQTELVKNAFAPCPLQVPLEDNGFCPRATSTPTMSPESPGCSSSPENRSSAIKRKPVKRKLQFTSEDEEAVFYLQSKYLNQENFV